MKFEIVPTLEKLRDVYLIPPGPGRFQAYMNAAVGGAQTAGEVALPPLAVANPMAKKHALEFVERWIELGAEEVAQEVLAEASARLDAVPFAPSVKVGLTVLDDVGGGWTNRTINDAARFQAGSVLEQTGWVSVGLWTSEAPDPQELRLVLLEAAYRAASTARSGDPKNLRAMMRQEGLAAAFARRPLTLDSEELDYSRAVIKPHLESTHQPTVMACLYGDEAVRNWGYLPFGLSRNAGFEVGLADALKRPTKTSINVFDRAKRETGGKSDWEWN